MRFSAFSIIATVGNAGLARSSADFNASGNPSNAQAVLAVNFPDPSLIQVETNWYAFSTSGNGKHVQVAASPSFLAPEWKLLDNIDALPYPGAWAVVNDTNIWAPDVIELVSQRVANNGVLTLFPGKWQICDVLCSHLARRGQWQDNALCWSSDIQQCDRPL